MRFSISSAARKLLFLLSILLHFFQGIQSVKEIEKILLIKQLSKISLG